jgi:hypothetical protein
MVAVSGEDGSVNIELTGTALRFISLAFSHCLKGL